SLTTRNASPSISIGLPDASSIFAVLAGWYETSNPGPGACSSNENKTLSVHSSAPDVTFVRYIVSRFSFAELFCGDVEALRDGMQSGIVCIDGGGVDVVVGEAASLSFESLPHP